MKISKLHVLGFFMAALTLSTPFGTFAEQNSELPGAKVADAVLLIGDHQGIDEIDAQSAAQLVAAELRKQGISVGNPVYEAPASASVYHLSFRRLGEKILVHLSQETAIGTIVIERQLWIADIEEMIAAAPRLVDALVHKKPIASTVDIESVTEQEARVLRKITGESLWHFGLLGIFAPSIDIVGAAGLEFGWSYETPSYAISTEFGYRVQEEADKFEDNDHLFSFFSWSIGGRYFFNKRNISPYVGGGLTLIGIEYETKMRVKKHKEWFGSAERYRELWGEEWEWVDEYNKEGDNGLGVYAAVGVEVLRLTQSRLNLQLRVDRPLFKLPTQDIMPITVGIFFSKNYVPGKSGCFLF